MPFLPCSTDNFSYWLNFVCFDDSQAAYLSQLGFYICLVILAGFTYLQYEAIKKDKRIRSIDAVDGNN